MAFFGKKTKTPAQLKAEIKQLQSELEALEGPKPVDKQATPPAKTDPETNKSASNALFATLSHELRTPLNGVLGMAQLLKENNTDSKLDTLESCAQHMQSVLHTLVNLSKIQEEWGELPEHREWINMHDFMEQVKQNLTLRASNRHLKIEIEHHNNTTRLRGDYDHLTNMIETAILGSLECTDINAEGAPAVLTVKWRNNQSGIKVTIINPLETMPSSRGSRISEVSGLTTSNSHSRIRMEFLYWAVSISLLENHQGGMIASKLDGNTGVKTILVFQLESMEASPSNERPVGGLTLSVGGKAPNPLVELPFCMKVLIVEDDPINRELMSMLLERIGQKSAVAVNGQAALDIMLEDPEFDLVLMDIDMPVLDGMATTRALRIGEVGDIGMNIPIVAVTAFNTLSDQSKFKKAGMDHFLCKPVSLKDLRSVLLEINRKKKEE
ncbi:MULTISPECIES: hybrid sensor histidine kinase/response regulator [unclassified Lentimonas]|uniref:response regulator n=1 Tax=unclassified Lentimonas TaxID=2630993 RepID=UPI00132834BD|nr:MULTISPECIES: hybrid sensor histidine kinase/response regulator [unclassified Lentimonas]CAA6679977.1 Unannotated [Lentimonas sp. CC4]CAA6686533.1 Unannotated [Lentimonas sp. CC6]CAA7074809.1 Unannotated [Lentimonas sp. CC4]CAA7169436.1 Unannotated [Lentimonas sp. CC21]CAA7180173.1 Unannotated [Lentimonas sp. CC8]